MFLLSIIKDLGKAFTVVCAFFLFSGIYCLLKPTEEDRVIGQQLKMYPFGFHSTDQNGEDVVIQVDSKSQVSVSTDRCVYRYTMKNALYRNDEKMPFGCEMEIRRNGIDKNLIIYIDSSNQGLKDVRYESCDDKDLIYEVAGKLAKKNKLKNVHVQL